MAERRAAKGRRLGSSRRKQLQEGSGETPALAPAPGPGEELEWASEIVQRVQEFFREQEKDQVGFVTRSDMQKLQKDIPCSMEELELLFDGLDTTRTGQLSTEEFTAGLRQFLSSQKAARVHHRRKTASRRVRLVLPSPVLEGVDSEEQRHFTAFMDQLGTDNASEEQEMWQLWQKLRQDEPQLLGNLEDFLAKMRHRIQEARSKKEALEVTLNKRVAEHEKEVQQLCEALEQQIQQEKQRLERESVARSHQQSVELQQALDASEREVQRLVAAQLELERRCRSLRSARRAASTENQQLEESNRALENHLQHLHQQLQQTQGYLRTTRSMVAWEHREEPGDRAVAELPGEVPMSPQMSPERHRSEMRIRLGSWSREPQAKGSHQVVWEMLPAETSHLGDQPRVSSVEEDPFPPLKEEHSSDQSSLLREMNDAIAALSKQLKSQALGTPPAPTDTAQHPQDDAEPQRGLEAATACGTTPGVLPGTHLGHELLEGDLEERPAMAKLHIPDVTQAGGSLGSWNHRAQEPGGEQGGQVPMGGLGLAAAPEEHVGLRGEADPALGIPQKLEIKPGEPLEPEPPSLGEAERGAAQGDSVLTEVMVAPGPGMLEEEEGGVEVNPWGEASGDGSVRGDIVLGGTVRVAVTVPHAEVQGGGAGTDVQPLEAQSSDANQQLLAEVEAGLQPPSEAESQGKEQGGSVDPDVQPLDPVENQELVDLEPEDEQKDTELLGGASPATLQGEESQAAVQLLEEAEDGAQGQGEQELSQETLLDLQGGKGGAGEQLEEETVTLDVLGEQGPGGNVQLRAEVEELKGGGTEADLQPLSEAGSLGMEQGGSVDPDVQPLEEEEEEDKPGLGQGAGAAGLVHREGPSPAETPVGSPELCGMFPVEAQGLDLVQAEESWAGMELLGSVSPETPQQGEDGAAMQLLEEAEDGAQGQGEQELPQELVLDLQGAGARQGEGAGAGEQLEEETVILDMLGEQGPGGNVQLRAEVEELKGGGTEADLQPLSEVSSLDAEQGGSVAPDVQPLDWVDKPELVELQTEGAQADMGLSGDLSPEAPQGGEVGAGLQPWEEAVVLDRLEDQSSGGSVKMMTEVEELKLAPGGNTEADRAALGAAGLWEGEQRQSWEAGLCAAPTADVWDEAAGARVSPPAQASWHSEHAMATKGPGLEALLEALTGPDGQILDNTQTLEITQGETMDAEKGPLDEAQGLEVVQGERVEAGVRNLVETQRLGRKQDHDDGASVMAPPASRVTLQINTLELETMIQEDVLIPDVCLGSFAQAAQSDLQGQVSAQADEVRLHAASQQLEEKPPRVMETEQVAVGSAEPPKQEVPPASALPVSVQQEEDAGNDQWGTVLGGSSLGGAANSNVQPQWQLWGEDPNVGQREKKREVGQKMSREGKSSPGEPGAVVEAGAAPRGSPEACLDPDHLYNVLFVGDSDVGKTSFLHRLRNDTFNPHLAATVGLDYQVKNLVVDNKCFALRLWDSAGQERYRSVTKQFFRKADGVVLMYDITSEYSFSDVRYWLSCIQEAAGDGVAVLLLGNKTDRAAERRVPTSEGELLAKEHQLMFLECSAASGHNISEAMLSLVRLLKVREDELKNKAEEVPKPPQKKKGCCW